MYDAVGEVLLECVEESDEDEVKCLCKTLYALLSGEGREEFAESADQPEAARLLDAPVQLSTKLKVAG